MSKEHTRYKSSHIVGRLHDWLICEILTDSAIQEKGHPFPDGHFSFYKSWLITKKAGFLPQKSWLITKKAPQPKDGGGGLRGNSIQEANSYLLALQILYHLTGTIVCLGIQFY